MLGYLTNRSPHQSRPSSPASSNLRHDLRPSENRLRLFFLPYARKNCSLISERTRRIFLLCVSVRPDHRGDVAALGRSCGRFYACFPSRRRPARALFSYFIYLSFSSVPRSRAIPYRGRIKRFVAGVVAALATPIDFFFFPRAGVITPEQLFIYTT